MASHLALSHLIGRVLQFSLVLNRERSCSYNLGESLHRTLPMRDVCKTVLSRVSLPALNYFKSVIHQPTSWGPREAAGVVAVQTPRFEQQGPSKTRLSSGRPAARVDAFCLFPCPVPDPLDEAAHIGEGGLLYSVCRITRRSHPETDAPRNTV